MKRLVYEACPTRNAPGLEPQVLREATPPSIDK